MEIRSTDSIYQVIDKVIRAAAAPMSAPELMDIPEVRKAATARFCHDIQIAVNKLSDTLGFMWRRNMLVRYPVTSTTSKASSSYGPKEEVEAEVRPILPPAHPSKKPVFNVTESSDAVTFEFEHFILTVKKR